MIFTLKFSLKLQYCDDDDNNIHGQVIVLFDGGGDDAEVDHLFAKNLG